MYVSSITQASELGTEGQLTDKQPYKARDQLQMWHAFCCCEQYQKCEKIPVVLAEASSSIFPRYCRNNIAKLLKKFTHTVEPPAHAGTLVSAARTSREDGYNILIERCDQTIQITSIWLWKTL